MSFDLNNLTVGIPSYNTPQVLLYALKSLVSVHPNWNPRIIISENSTNEEAANLLKKLGIPFYRNLGSKHSPSVQDMMDKCKTKYFLHLDSDILFLNPVISLFDLMEKNGLTVLGEIQRDRGGYKLKPRVAPYFCLMNMEKVRVNGCLYHDQERIDKTGSQGFFNNLPIQENGGSTYYDVGSVFYEDCERFKLKIGDMGVRMGTYVLHVESISWAPNSGIKGYEDLGKFRLGRFMEAAKKFDNVELRGRFVDGLK